MATLFSLQGSELCLEIPANGAVNLQRKLAAVETLDGVQVRDLGRGPEGMKLSFATELDNAPLATLSSAVEAGLPLGLSCGIHTFAVLAEKLASRRLLHGGNGVTLDLMVERRI